MKVRVLYMFFLIAMGLPCLAMALSTGTPNWHTLPQPQKSQFHGECCYNAPITHGIPPSHTPVHTTGNAVCDLAGEWKETPYSKAWGLKRLTEHSKSGPTLIQYSVQEFGIRGELHEIADYDANHHSVAIYTFTSPDIFSYATGTVSPDCHQITLTNHDDNFSLPRQTRLNFVRR